jgi:hypothetical protein
LSAVAQIIEIAVEKENRKLQEKYVAAGALKLDEEGKCTLDLHASSGRYFNFF